MISEYNLRQLALMQDRIKYYRKEQIEIGELISNLEALVNYLEEVNIDWKDSFFSALGILELTYAVALHNNKSSLDDSDIAEINEGLKKINTLINSLLVDDIGREVDVVINILSKPVTKNNQDHGWYEGSQREILNLFERLKSDIVRGAPIEDNSEYQNFLEKVRTLGVDTGELYGHLTLISDYISNLKCCSP